MLKPPQGSIIYRGADAWQNLPPGKPGQVLALNEASEPVWMDWKDVVKEKPKHGRSDSQSS
jgi:hypothetical protein